MFIFVETCIQGNNRVQYVLSEVWKSKQSQRESCRNVLASPLIHRWNVSLKSSDWHFSFQWNQKEKVPLNEFWGYCWILASKWFSRCQNNLVEIPKIAIAPPRIQNHEQNCSNLSFQKYTKTQNVRWPLLENTRLQDLHEQLLSEKLKEVE